MSPAGVRKGACLCIRSCEPFLPIMQYPVPASQKQHPTRLHRRVGQLCSHSMGAGNAEDAPQGEKAVGRSSSTSQQKLRAHAQPAMVGARDARKKRQAGTRGRARHAWSTQAAVPHPAQSPHICATPRAAGCITQQNSCGSALKVPGSQWGAHASGAQQLHCSWLCANVHGWCSVAQLARVLMQGTAGPRGRRW
jgi:hypothetical protein